MTLRTCLAPVVFAIGLGLSAAHVQAAPLEAYGKLPVIQGVAISPNGEKLAVITSDGEHRDIAVKSLGSDKPDIVVRAGTIKARSVTWIDDDRLVIFTTTTAPIIGGYGPVEKGQLVEYDLDADAFYPLMGDVKNGANIAAAPPLIRTIDGATKMIAVGYEFDAMGRGWPSLYVIDPLTHKSRHLLQGSFAQHTFTVDARGQAVGAVLHNPQTRDWALKLRDGDDWRPILSLKAPDDPPEVEGTGRDGESLLVEQREGDRVTLREVAPGATTWPAPFWSGEDAPRLIWDRDFSHLVGLQTWVDDERRFEWFDPARAARAKTLAAAFPGQILGVASESADGQRIVVRADSPTEGPAYAWVDLRTKQARWIGPQYALGPNDISPMRPLSFKTSDGLTVHGYVTLPRGRPAKGLPLVIEPNSDPDGRDVLGFDWLDQALASQGYAVAEINYRGSSGYGAAFRRAGDGQWDGKVQADLVGAIRNLAGQGIVDPKKVCILGNGFGGYLALMASVTRPDAYRCIVTLNARTSVRRLADNRYLSPVTKRRYGVENASDARVRELSPDEEAHRVGAPVLLIRSAADAVIPPINSESMGLALKRAGKPYEEAVLAQEDHWLSYSATREQALKAIAAFLEKNNPPN